MKNASDHHLHEALDLIDSDKSQVFVSDLAETIKEAIEKAKGSQKGEVEMATSFTEEEKKLLNQVLDKIFARHVDLTYQTRPSLLGGFRVSVGDWKLDASLLSDIETLKRKLGGSI